MIVPFVNWFWKRDRKSPDISFRLDMPERLNRFMEAQREWDARLANFEAKLHERGMYEEYMDLRNSANRVNLEWNRVEFGKEMLEKMKL